MRGLANLDIWIENDKEEDVNGEECTADRRACGIVVINLEGNKSGMDAGYWGMLYVDVRS